MKIINILIFGCFFAIIGYFIGSYFWPLVVIRKEQIETEVIREVAKYLKPTSTEVIKPYSCDPEYKYIYDPVCVRQLREAETEIKNKDIEMKGLENTLQNLIDNAKLNK